VAAYDGDVAMRLIRSEALDAEDALGYVCGCTCLDYFRARDPQYADRQFVRGKSLDTFCPMGHWRVMADEIPTPGTAPALPDQRRRRPAGVGWFREPKRMVRDGDEVVVEIESVGRLVNRCVEERQ
jgi:2-keto-4-pentenoate hydratase/2-oxohepta-3-ene-1,7-dioic acid hydratase in catechol pathway